MIYETFLFTRNQMRDFTAFIRPVDLTNHEVSVIASALNNVHNITMLSPEWPALYSLAIGEYLLLLRHYNSGRTHAGRAIGVIEGIAVRRSLQRHYALAVPHFVAQQADVLAIADSVDDIETLIIERSAEQEWPDVQAEAAQASVDEELITEFIARLETDRLFLPFTPAGRSLLIAALGDTRLRTPFFAFGTNAQVLAHLSQAGSQVDIVSYFNTTRPALRDRETNDITIELTDFEEDQPLQTPESTSSESDMEAPVEIAGDSRWIRQTTPPQPRNPEDDPLAQYDAGEEAMLTPREMRRERQQQMAETTEAEPSESRRWLVRLLARLLGRD